MSKSKQYSLAEAHKVHECLQRDINVLQGEINEASRPVTALVVSDKEKVIAARTKIRDGLKTLRGMQAQSLALGEAISCGNDKVGINQLLKRRNLLTNQRTWVDDLLRTLKPSGLREQIIDHTQVDSYFERMRDANSVNNVSIRVVDDEHVGKDIKALRTELQGEIDEINRTISSINHKTMIEVDFL